MSIYGSKTYKWATFYPTLKLLQFTIVTSFCMGSITLQCPSLSNIRVDSCPEMYAMACTREVGGGEKTPFFSDKVLCDSLQLLTVKGCHNFEYVFPSSLIKSFVRLSHLGIIDCKNIEEVIFTDETATEEVILFARLQLLEINGLPKLGTFWHGGDNSETDSTTLFNEKVVFPRLIHLLIEGIGKCEKIWHDKATVDSFYELTHLIVEDCARLLNILPLYMVERLEKLKEVIILECGSLEEIIGADDDDIPHPNESHTATGTSTQSIELKTTTKFVFPKLQTLILGMLPELEGFYSKLHTTELPSLEKLIVGKCGKVETFAGEYMNFQETQGESSQPLLSVPQPLFWVTQSLPNLEKLLVESAATNDLFPSLVPSSVSFKHLTTLQVSQCHGFRNLVTFTTAKSMVQLTRMTVTDCQMLEEIITSTTDEVTDGIFSSQLKSLELDCLPTLSRFCSGKYTLEFPSLEQVIIRWCPKIKFFTKRKLSTPMLHGLQSSKDEYVGHWEGDLNVTLQQLFVEKVHILGVVNSGIPLLRGTDYHRCGKLENDMAAAPNQQREDSFCKLLNILLNCSLVPTLVFCSVCSYILWI
ncbi:hypothetical protein V6N13_014661 [Hibiscus sabdariffa]